MQRAIVPPGTPPATTPPPPRRRFTDGTAVTDDVYVLRMKNWTYLISYSDTPVVSGLRRPLFLATYLIAAGVFAFVVAIMNSSEQRNDDARLAREGVETRGVVTAAGEVRSGKSGTAYRIDFQFVAPASGGQDGSIYRGATSTRDQGLADFLRPGTPVTVRYVPDAPHIAQMVAPRLERGAITLQERQGVLILVVPCLFYPPRLAVWWWLRRRERELIRDGVLLRAEVDVRREYGLWRTWDTVIYRFRAPDGAWITAQARREGVRTPKSEAKAAVLYLNRRRFALL